MKKRFLVWIMVFVLLLTQMPSAQAMATSASSVVLMDADSGRVLYEKNSHEQRLIASITKLMTALVALESGHSLSEEVTIHPEWVGVEGSSIYLRAGETVSLETLLYGMLLRSGNDAALAIAGYCADSVDRFVAKMNQKAHELGMKNSSFANPNGLNAQGHYSSAYDMALLARACLEHETLRQIVSTKSKTMGERSFTNHNKLLWRYEGCIGLKTGYTEKAGRTLVSAAQRDGMTLICVTLNDPNDWADHAALFDSGFSRYHPKVVVEEGEMVGQLPVEGGLIPVCPVLAGAGCTVAVEAGERVDVQLSLETDSLCAPVVKGQRVGELTCSLDGSILDRIPLLAGQTIPCNEVEYRGILSHIFG